MSNLSVPPLLQQIRENMLNPNNNAHVRFNYSQTMMIIKEYAEKSLKEYDKLKDTAIRKRGY
jgi:hypothetical protein